MLRDAAYLMDGGTWSLRLAAAHERPDFVREVHDRAALYPETIALAKLMTDGPALQAMLNPSLTEPGRRDVTRRLLSEFIKADLRVLVDRLIFDLRHARERLEDAVRTQDRQILKPVWFYEDDLRELTTDPLTLRVDLSSNTARDDPIRVKSLYVAEFYDEGSMCRSDPGLLAEWNHRENVGLVPEQLTAGSRALVSWRCRRGHEWRAKVNVRKRVGCPYCNRHQVLAGFNDLATIDPGLVNEWDFEANGTLRPDGVMAGSSKRVGWVCKTGHRWPAQIASRRKGVGCPVCANKLVVPGVNDLGTIDPARADYWDHEANGALTPQTVTCGSAKSVAWICSLGHRWTAKIAVVGRKRSSGCPYCSGLRVLRGFNDIGTTRPDLLQQWDYERNTINPGQVTSGSSEQIWWRCSCGHRWRTAPNSRKAIGRCPSCSTSK